MPDQSIRRATLLCAVAVLAGCASNKSLESDAAAAPTDPWEGLNRPIYAFNTSFDRYTLKPVAKGYGAVVPAFARRGVSNFSTNLLAPPSALNNLLQGKPVRSLSEITRFVINTTVGVGGLIDWATMGGIERHHEDFGQTLAVWGVADGPYVVLPIFGPSTLRDAFAFPVRVVSDPLFHVSDSSLRDPLVILRTIDLRYRLFSAERLLEDSKDPYLTVRESYLQNRRYDVFDGNPPADDDFYDDFEDDFDDLDEDPETSPETETGVGDE
ncbi:MAG: VacJ family lipoprotein [Pseudomonadota bacterium]